MAIYLHLDVVLEQQTYACVKQIFVVGALQRTSKYMIHCRYTEVYCNIQCSIV